MQTNEVNFDFHKWVKPIFTTNKRYIHFLGGRGRGGSHQATEYFSFKLIQPQYFRGYFMRNSFSDIRDSLFRDFKDRLQDNETLSPDHYRIQENEMRITHIPTGNSIASRGFRKDGSRTAKMKSLAGVTHVIIEEADEIGEEEFDQMDLSLRTIKSDIQIIMVFNPPPKEHWIWKKGYILKESGIDGFLRAEPVQSSDVLSLFATYRENVANLNDAFVEQLEAYKEKKPWYYYTVVDGLISEGQRGRIYNGWTQITDQTFNDVEARSIIGLDFGVHTGSLVEVKIIKSNMYVRELFYGGGTAKEVALKLIDMRAHEQPIIADSADPAKIALLRYGTWSDSMTPEEEEKYADFIGWEFEISPVAKPPGSILFGIDRVQDMNVFMTDTSANGWAEYANYKWALDKNKNPIDEPIDDYNHILDPVRYVAASKGRLF